MHFLRDHNVWRFRRAAGSFLCLAMLALAIGCAGPKPAHIDATASHRRFDFSRDTFHFANELVWQYSYDDHGHWGGHRREPKPDYTLHCFVLARSAAQFFREAEFDPGSSVADEDTYRKLVREVVTRNPRKGSADCRKITFPGYKDLKQFSEAHEQLLKSECGHYLQSYFERGNWRMIFPFSRRHQALTAAQLQKQLAHDQVAVVHLVQFPKLTINHAVLVFEAQEGANETRFLAYDPNEPTEPIMLTYENKNRTFQFPPTKYFPGGRVSVYQIYHRWNY